MTHKLYLVEGMTHLCLIHAEELKVIMDRFGLPMSGMSDDEEGIGCYICANEEEDALEKAKTS